MAEREGTFYPIWPVLDGKPLNLQWGEIRSNTAETKAIVRSSVQELGSGDELNAVRSLIGLELGDTSFRNKFRFYYDKTNLELIVQKNDGTVDSPSWTDCWQVRFNDGQLQSVGQGGIQSAAGFYGPGLQSIREVAESGSSADTSILNPTKLFFNADSGLEVTAISSGANAGAPQVTFTAPFGKAQTFAKSGKEWAVQHNFGTSPLLVQVMDSDRRVVIPDKADVSDPNIAYFYFDSSTTGEVLIASGGTGAVSLVPRDPFYLVARTNTDSSDGRLMSPNAHLVFDASYFYVDVDLDTDTGGARKQAFVSLHSTPSAVAANDHGSLTGLTDDDHSQYTLVDGTRAFTGAVDLGGNNLTNVGIITGDAHVENALTAEAFYIKDGGELNAYQWLAPSGTSPTPALSFRDHPTTGFVYNGNWIEFWEDGSLNIDFSDTTMRQWGALRIANGTAGSPSLNFIFDTDTGFFSPGGSSNQIGITCGGDEVGRFGNGGLNLNDRCVAAGFYLSPGANGIGHSLNRQTINFDIPTVLVDNYWLENFTDQAFIVKDIRARTQRGSCAISFYIHKGVGEEGNPGVGITGLDYISVDSHVTEFYLATAENIVNVGDSLVMSVPKNSLALHLRGRVAIDLAG